MILIIGGSYQGKLDFARERFGLVASEMKTPMLSTFPAAASPISIASR